MGDSDTAAADARPLVLYVDDERANRIVFEQSLKADFRIKSVANAKAALEMLDQVEVGVLVSDIRMAEMDGLELLRLAKEKHPHTLRMVITAYSDIDPILRAINEGLVVRYIVKPWNRDELRQVLYWATEVFSFGRDNAELQRRLVETERMATLGGITAAYVHDLKYPLMTINGAADELQKLVDVVPKLRQVIEAAGIDASAKEELLSNLEVVPELISDSKDGVATLNGMIALLNEFLQPGLKRTERPLIDPVPIMRHVVAMHQRLGTAKTVINYQGPKVLPHIRMSPAELTQVLLNVIGNARQAVEARGEPNKSVAVDGRVQGNMVELSIRDEGVGMPPEVLRKVGTPWFTTRKEGTGLGLANCQRVIGVSGGRLRIESEQGVGTTVTILLPTAA